MLLPSHTSSHGRDNPALQVFQTGNDFAAFPPVSQFRPSTFSPLPLCRPGSKMSAMHGRVEVRDTHICGQSQKAAPTVSEITASQSLARRGKAVTFRLSNSLAFGRGLFLALLLATPAAALERVSVFEDAPKGAAWFARIVIENEQGSATRTHTLETSKGAVSLSYFTTSNTPCQAGVPFNPLDCADDVVVRDLPDGVTASPLSVQVVEDGTAEILLYQFMGF